MSLRTLLETLAATVASFILLSSCSDGTSPGSGAGSGAIIAQPVTGGQAQLAKSEEADADDLGMEGPPDWNQWLREPWTGDLDGMFERRYIRVLVVPSKTMYFYDGGQPRGITYEAMREFERFLNRKRGRPATEVNIVFVPVSRDRLIGGLIDGSGDIAAANLTITPERSRLVDFSVPLLAGVNEVVVTGPDSPTVGSVADLANQEVYIRRSSSYYESLQHLNARFQAAGRPAVTIRTADENLEDEDILEMLNAGLIGITIVDSHKATFWAKVFDNITPHLDVAISEGRSIGWAIRRDCPVLAAMVNEFARNHKESTAFGNTLLRRYLRNTKWVRNATSKKEKARFETLVGLFQKYSTQYEFDWMMVAAQAYQESRLDHSVKSPVGAVGIMQVMPATATAPPIGIPDVNNLGSNIHAGVKILRHYSDHYFSGEEIDDLNRMLFSFAAYNIGPSRVARLRKRAPREGLDPNVWFRNVELVAEKSVGREPVRYVSNIFKYYTAYKLASEEAKPK